MSISTKRGDGGNTPNVLKNIWKNSTKDECNGIIKPSHVKVALGKKKPNAFVFSHSHPIHQPRKLSRTTKYNHCHEDEQHPVHFTLKKEYYFFGIMCALTKLFEKFDMPCQHYFFVKKLNKIWTRMTIWV